MFENKRTPPIGKREFASRVLRHLTIAVVLIVFSLGGGVLGYHFLGQLSWVDSLLNASMILGGMGPVDPLPSDAAKVFASAYALFSGLVFIGVAGLMLGPFVHRMVHRFHWDDDA